VRADLDAHALTQGERFDVRVEELRPEVPDHREVDPVLHLCEGVAAGSMKDGPGSGESLVKFHLMPP